MKKPTPTKKTPAPAKPPGKRTAPQPPPGRKAGGTGLTLPIFDLVEEAAEELKSEGIRPTIAHVQARLPGKISSHTINVHLNVWKIVDAARSIAAAKAPITDEIAELRARLIQAEKQIQQLKGGEKK